MELKRHSTWEVFANTETFEIFRKNFIPEFYFKNQVSEDVKRSFKITEKLLFHSYYEYEFYDVAAAKALMDFEMALKIRYKELTGEEWEKKIKKGEKRRNLKNLLDWFQQKHYFEVIQDKYLDHVRMVRNSFAHPNRHSFGGAMIRQWIENPIDLINDLYEDCKLRQERKEKQKLIVDLLSKTLNSGSILEFDSFRFIVYKAEVVFVDNRCDTEIVYLIFHPIFELEDLYPSGGYKNYELVYIMTDKLAFSDDYTSVTFYDYLNKSNIRISPIVEAEDKLKYDEWNMMPKSMDLHLHISSLNMKGGDWFSHIRREFHKEEIVDSENEG